MVSPGGSSQTRMACGGNNAIAAIAREINKLRASSGTLQQCNRHGLNGKGREGLKLSVMRNIDQPDVNQLGKGQLWRLKRRYVLIVALENLIVRFKLMDTPGETGERTLTGERDTLWRYLLSRNGELVGR